MRLQTLLEYDRERARQALGDGLWKAALRDQFRLWFKPLDQLKDLRPTSISPNAHKFIMDVFDRPDMQRDVADRALQEIEAADPSTNKKYTQWMARQFATGQVAKMEDVVSTLADYMARFHDLSTRKKLPVDRRDINRYKKYQEMFDTVDWYEDQEPEDETKGKARKAYEDDDVTVVIPEDEAAACKYGRKTRWCTASTKGQNYFDHYNRQGPLYILIPKVPKHDNEKYQLHFPSGQYMDEDDDHVQLRKIIGDRFPGLLQFFMGVPEARDIIKDSVEFADDETLDRITGEIWELARDRVYDLLSDWETSDDYYYEWLRKEGYMDDDGNLKDDAPSYLDYNDEARIFESNMEEFINVGVNELRRIAARAVGEGAFDEDTIYNIEGLLSYNIRERMGRRESDGGMADWIDKNIMIKRTADGPKVELVKRSRP